MRQHSALMLMRTILVLALLATLGCFGSQPKEAPVPAVSHEPTGLNFPARLGALVRQPQLHTKNPYVSGAESFEYRGGSTKVLISLIPEDPDRPPTKPRSFLLARLMVLERQFPTMVRRGEEFLPLICGDSRERFFAADVEIPPIPHSYFATSIAGHLVSLQVYGADYSISRGVRLRRLLELLGWKCRAAA